MVDDDYHEPVLAAEFHNDLSISPGGMIYNSSIRQLGDQSQDPQCF